MKQRRQRVWTTDPASSGANRQQSNKEKGGGDDDVVREWHRVCDKSGYGLIIHDCEGFQKSEFNVASMFSSSFVTRLSQGTRVRVIFNHRETLQELVKKRVRIDQPIEGWFEVEEILRGIDMTYQGGKMRPTIYNLVPLTANDAPQKIFGYWVSEGHPWKILAEISAGRDCDIMKFYGTNSMEARFELKNDEREKSSISTISDSFQEDIVFPRTFEITFNPSANRDRPPLSGKLLNKDRIEWEDGHIWIKLCDVEEFLTVEGHLMTDVEKKYLHHEGFMGCVRLVAEKRNLLYSTLSEFSAQTIQLIWSYTYFISYRGRIRAIDMISCQSDWRFQVNKCMRDVNSFSSHIFILLLPKLRIPSFGGIAAMFGGEDDDGEDHIEVEFAEDPFLWENENYGCVEEFVFAHMDLADRDIQNNLSKFTRCGDDGMPRPEYFYALPNLDKIHFMDGIIDDVTYKLPLYLLSCEGKSEDQMRKAVREAKCPKDRISRIQFEDKT